MTFVQKIGGMAVVAAVLVATASHYNMVPGALTQKAAVPKAFDLPGAPDVPVAPKTTAPLALPGTKAGKAAGPVVRANVWAWNAQMGLILANGGPSTTAGSLMEKHGVSLRLIRQNDTEVTKGEQIKFAQALASGESQPSDGVQFAIIMGDGAAQYLAGAAKLLDKLGPDYRAEVVGAVGYSRGEDGWWGPGEWQATPAAMKGGTTVGVCRDGDWNIAQYKLANDGIKNNPDETTWDPDAMNWICTDDYLKAVEIFIAGTCEDRPVVRDGKRTNEPKHRACPDGYVTWTPGDVNGAKKKGGLVRLLSTKENVYQMPAVVIGIHKWDAANRKRVEEMLAAALEGGDQVRSYPEALSRAGQASYAVYAEESAAYWVKYYKGVVERDKTGVPVPLGGSSVMNLADNLLLFGLSEGSGGLSASLFRATYEGFGNIVKQQYPKLMPSFPPVDQAVDTSYLAALAQRMAASSPDVQVFEDTAAAPIPQESKVAQRDWSIQFDTGKWTFTPEAEATLQRLYDQLAIGGALQVEIDGHTDNAGNPAANRTLSEQRAAAVKQWLEAKSAVLFPANRVSVRAFGDTVPVATNATPEGRARNRRVTVILGTKG